VYTYTHTHAYINAYAYIYTDIHIHRHTYIPIHTYTHTHIHAYMNTHIHTHAYTHVCTDRNSQQQRLNVSIYIIDTHTHPYAYACIYTHIYDNGLWSLFDFFATFSWSIRSLIYGAKKHFLSLLHLFYKSSWDKCPRDQSSWPHLVLNFLVETKSVQYNRTNI